mmetsp:Transcript_141035/g.351750  ORF Transcript_141035/g.351750 Transcript_141035/m.351750 type:complete len:208 (-) Transcript_141035:1014-1637(-)
MYELWVLVANLPNAAEVPVGLCAKVRATSLRGEDAVAACVLDHAQGGVARDQKPVLCHERVDAKALEIQWQLQEVWSIVNGQSDSSCHPVAVGRARYGIKVNWFLGVILLSEEEALLLWDLRQDLTRCLRHLWEVLLPEVLEHTIQRSTRFQQLHLLPRCAVAARNAIEAWIDVLLRHRNPAPNKGVEVGELLNKCLLIVLQTLHAA